MNTVEQIAAFTLRARHEDLSASARERLKCHVLDTLGCAIGALSAAPVRQIRAVIDEFGGRELCTMIGGGKTSPDRAALFNGALVRYLDFMDNFVAKNEVCHPADNFGALLVAAEYAGRSGQELLTALAVAYQVQCRLIEEVPTMRAGINYTTPLAFSVAAGVSRLLGLNAVQTANALALAGVDAISLAVIQAEPVSQWKGLASADVNMHALQCVFLARAGITGPLGVFDGPVGLYDLVKHKADIDWSKEGLDVIERCAIKKFNAEFQSQAVLEAVMLLRQELGDLANGDAIEEITVDVPRGAYEVIGGGEYGPKTECHIKEQADHNLPYLVAVALLDGEVWPEQFDTERINRADVQALLRKVTVRPKMTYSWSIPKELPARVTVSLHEGATVHKEVTDYPGFHTRPMSWEQVRAKFDRVTAPFAEPERQERIADLTANLEQNAVSTLIGELAGLPPNAV